MVHTPAGEAHDCVNFTQSTLNPDGVEIKLKINLIKKPVLVA